MWYARINFTQLILTRFYHPPPEEIIGLLLVAMRKEIVLK